MSRYDYLIIGGGIAGITVAETVRREAPLATIAVVGNERHLLYSRVLLPAYLKKRIPREALFLRTTDEFSKNRIDLFLGEEVVSINTVYKEIGFAGGLAIGYKKLCIASGGKVRPWGTDDIHDSIYRLQTIDDADRLCTALPNIRGAVVVGASFIGLEFLEIFSMSGIPTVLLTRDSHFFSRVLEPEGAALLDRNFKKNKIDTQYSDTVDAIEKHDSMLIVRTKGFQVFPCDALAMGIGIERNMEFLEGSDIERGEHGIRTNEFLETNVADVFAAGDIAEFYDLISEKHHVWGNWTNAFLQGSRAGLNMIGKREPFKKVASYSITNLGLHITALGECSAEAESIIRIDHGANQYERLCIQDDRIIGAALIDRFQDKKHIAALIESRKSIREYKEALRDFSFDIKNIPVVP